MASLEIKQLQALIAVLEEQHFDKAASRLYVTQSAVSQRIKQLEEQLGQPVVRRGTPITATAAGQKVLRYARQVTLLQDELLRDLGHSGPGMTKLSIAVNADSLASWFLDAVQPLISSHELIIELKVDDQEQTHELLKNGEVSGCISSNDQAMPGCDCQYLGKMNYHCVASDGFYQRYFASGVNADSFAKAPAVEFSHSDELQQHYLRHYFNVAEGSYPSHHIPSSEKYLDFIARGLAWGLVPEMQLQQFSNQYSLRDISPDKLMSVPLYWHSWSLKSAAIDKLSTAVLQHAESALR